MAKKTREQLEIKAEQDLFAAYLEAVDYLKKLAAGKVPDDKGRRLTSVFLVEQERGRARQMHQHTGENGGPVTVRVIYGNGN